MSNSFPAFPALKISSYHSLVGLQAELVQRINRVPQGGRLLLIHPRRLFADLNVSIADEVFEDWSRTIGGSFLAARSEADALYEAAQQSDPAQSGKVVVHGLFHKASA